jgi:hypothetical protein
VAPKIVSGRVVNTRTDGGAAATSPVRPAVAVDEPYTVMSTTGKVISAPTDLPIQFRCAVFVLSDQSRWSRFASRRPA